MSYTECKQVSNGVMEYNTSKKQYQYTEEIIKTMKQFLPTSVENQDLLDRLYLDIVLAPPRSQEDFLGLPLNEGYKFNEYSREREKSKFRENS